MQVQWYPGHMTKARRQIEENLKLVDLILELVDARVPASGRNPDIGSLGQQKPRLIVLTKADLADASVTERWIETYTAQGLRAIALDARASATKKILATQIREACREKLERDKRRGIRKSQIRVLVAGIPNVGKSTLINSLAKKASAKTGDRPGVTKGQQWIRLAEGIDLLDTPGLLWPKFESKEVGLRLAWIGSIREEVLATEELSLSLIDHLRCTYPNALSGRYGIDESGSAEEILTSIAVERGCIRGGGEADTEKAASLLLEEFRHAKLGRITLERPEA